MARTASRPKTEEKDQSGSARQKRSWTGPIVGILAVVALGALVVLDPEPPGVEFPSQGNLHLQSIDEPHAPYNSSPPSSGPHLGLLASWGVHDEPVPEELFIHNLEDGGVVVTYNCPDGCDDLQTGLEEFVLDQGRASLITPYEQSIVDPDGNQYRAAAVAWTKVFYFDELTDDVRSELGVFFDINMGIDHHGGTN